MRPIGSPKIFFVAKKIMFGANTLFFGFRHLELNFERNRDQEWTSFAQQRLKSMESRIIRKKRRFRNLVAVQNDVCGHFGVQNMNFEEI